MPLIVHRSNQVEYLAQLLGELLRDEPLPPLVEERVVVQSRGMQRWLAGALARETGVCAHVAFPFPARFVADALAAAVGPEAIRAAEAWCPERLQWTLMRVLPQALARPELAPLATYLRGGDSDRRLYQLARRVADTFDRYVTFRRDVVAAWQRGESGDGDAVWQAALWREVRAAVGVPHLGELAESLFERARGRRSPPLPGLPERVSLFAVTTLPPFYLEVLRAVATWHSVHLFTVAPSRQWIADLRPERVDQLALSRSDGHPLVASLGRLARDFQALVEAADPLVGEQWVEPAQGTALGMLQADVLHLRRRGPGGLARVAVAEDDRTLEFHACHGLMRQVEVLRDRIRALLDDDETLEPRDIVVMAPDIEACAPLVHAVFGARGPEGRRLPGDVPFHVADRASRRGNPVATALLGILALAGGRLPASEVYDLLCLEPVRARFGIAPDQLERAAAFIASAGIRWGRDASHREDVGQPADRQNTWRFGVQRMVLGCVMAAPADPSEAPVLYQGVRPLDVHSGEDARLIGRLVLFVDAVLSTHRELSGVHRMAAWRARLGAAVERLVATDDDRAPDLVRTLAVLDGLVDAVGEGALGDEERGAPPAVSLDVVRAAVGSILDDRSPGAGFLTGGVTFCAMVPMRSIPFRVVALLGMDDGAFPRAAHRPRFDLTSRSPRVGDRTPRDDDRYLFLEAILSARERLMVLYTGRSERNNERKAPAVPVGELLDVLCDTLHPAGRPGASADELLKRFVVEHPLQPFSPAAFAVGARARSRDPAWLAAARTLASGERASAPWLFRGPLPQPPVAQPSLPLRWLQEWARDPLSVLLRRRLGVVLADGEATLSDREPAELAGIDAWEIGDAVLRWQLEVAEEVPTEALLRAAGLLPPGAAGRVALVDVRAVAGAIAARARELRAGPRAQPLEVQHDAGPLRITGRVGDLFPGGRVVHTYARVAPRHILDLWMVHQVIQAVAPGTRSMVVGRAPTGGVQVVSLRPDPDWHEHLSWVLRVVRQGMEVPLPITPAASRAWFEVASYPEAIDRAGLVGKAVGASRRAWKDKWRKTGDWYESPFVQRVFGEFEPFADRDGLPGLPQTSQGHFHRLAVGLWRRVLADVERGR